MGRSRGFHAAKFLAELRPSHSIAVDLSRDTIGTPYERQTLPATWQVPTASDHRQPVSYTIVAPVNSRPAAIRQVLPHNVVPVNSRLRFRHWSYRDGNSGWAFSALLVINCSRGRARA
jgi:hypothetical protein